MGAEVTEVVTPPPEEDRPASKGPFFVRPFIL